MPFLYKYTAFSEHTESLISKPELWFSRPSKLNDPFELRPWYEFKYELHQLVEGFARQLRHVNPLMTETASVAEATGIVLQGRHRDPKMWIELRKDLAERLDQEIGLLCLSSRPDSILMWSHYGRDHTGVCLGFEWSSYTPFFGRAQKVKYQQALPVIDVFNASADSQVDSVFLTKYRDWRYEREWRIIDHECGEGLRPYPSNLLKTVTFGLNTKPKHRQDVRKWLSSRKHEVQLQECVRDEKEFKLHIRPAGAA